MDSLLLLLLGINSWLHWSGAAKAGEATQEWILVETSEGGLDIEASAMLTEDSVGVLDVCR